MKTTLLVLCLMALTAVAQTNSVPIPGATDAIPNAELAKLLVAVIVPIVVAGVKFVVPKLPRASIPPIAIAMGALADWLGALVGAWHFSWISGTVLGAYGIGVREAVVKLKKWNAPE